MNTQSETTPNAKLLENIAQYVTYLLKVFGVITTSDQQAIGFPVESGQTGNTVCYLIIIILTDDDNFID